jgi:hypothetical protein
MNREEFGEKLFVWIINDLKNCINRINYWKIMYNEEENSPEGSGCGILQGSTMAFA